MPADPAALTRLSRGLGADVRALREARGLTQRQLGALLDWDQPQVARLEAGAVTPNLATLGLLTERLGVQVRLRRTPAGVRVQLEPDREALGAAVPACPARRADRVARPRGRPGAPRARPGRRNRPRVGHPRRRQTRGRRAEPRRRRGLPLPRGDRHTEEGGDGGMWRAAQRRDPARSRSSQATTGPRRAGRRRRTAPAVIRARAPAPAR